MKSAILLPIIVVLVVVAAVVVVQVTGINPFVKPSEGGVVETAITELLDTKTYKVNGKVEIDVEALVGDTGEGALSVLPGVSSVKMFVDVSSNIDQRKKGNLKTSSNIKLGVDSDGMSLTGVIEVVTIGGELYIKLVSIPAMLTAFLGDVSSIKDRWIKIDLAAIKDKYIEAANIDGIGLDEEELSQQLKDLVSEMKGLLKDKTIFDVSEELGVEEINEISTNHYSIKANKEGIKAFILEYTELTKKYVPAEQKAEYDRNLESALENFSENFEKFWATVGDVEFDVWVEKGTGRLARILWQKDLDSSSAVDIPQEIESMSIEADFSFLNFNKNVDIKEPSGSKPLEDALSDMMSTFIPQGFEVPSLPEGF